MSKERAIHFIIPLLRAVTHIFQNIVESSIVVNLKQTIA